MDRVADRDQTPLGYQSRLRPCQTASPFVLDQGERLELAERWPREDIEIHPKRMGRYLGMQSRHSAAWPLGRICFDLQLAGQLTIDRLNQSSETVDQRGQFAG